MIRYFIVIISLLVVLGSCQNSENNSSGEDSSARLKESISGLEEELFNSSSLRLDRKKGLELIRLYEQYAREYPASGDAPEYLFKAADLSMNMRRPQATIALFDKILKDYPDYVKSPSALFLKAFVYEDQLQDYENARINYELFLSEYPESEFADDAEVSLKNLGKSPEELIKEFEKRDN